MFSRLWAIDTRADRADMNLAASTSLSYQQNVPRDLVHRAALGEVFVTDGRRMDESTFLVAAQWPRDHSFYQQDALGTADPLLVAETTRQAMLLVSHRFQGIPRSHRFIGLGLGFEVTAPELLRRPHGPLEIVLHVGWRWVANRPPQRYGMHLDIVFTVEGQACARAWIHILAVDEKRYQLLRGRDAWRTGDLSADLQRLPLPAAAVGRTRAKDVVLSAGGHENEWLLRLDVQHPTLYDHPCDHIPLMVLLEGFRQAGHVLQARGTQPLLHTGSHRLAAADVDCLAFGEPHLPVRLVAEPLDLPADKAKGRHWLINAVQGETVISSAKVRCTDPSARPSLQERLPDALSA